MRTVRPVAGRVVDVPGTRTAKWRAVDAEAIGMTTGTGVRRTGKSLHCAG